MNAAQIEAALRSDKFVDSVLVGICAADQLPVKEYPGAYIVNTDESHQPGQHWVAFYTANEVTECFDSFGQNPGKYSKKIEEWLSDNYRIVQNDTIQSSDSTVCGQYCMYFVLLRAYGFSMEDVLSSFNKNTKINDKFVCKFVNKFFRLRTSVQDRYFLIQKALGR